MYESFCWSFHANNSFTASALTVSLPCLGSTLRLVSPPNRIWDMAVANTSIWVAPQG